MDGATTNTNIKFLCSYGGRILPRYPDGKLRYHGGHTRVLSVHRSISFSELISKMMEMIGGSPVSLRCQLPTEDLDALVSITSDEDLANLLEEFDRASPNPPSKIRAFLSPPKSTKQVTSPPLSSSASSSSSTTTSSSSSSSPRSSQVMSKPPLPPSRKMPYYYGCYAHRNPSNIYLIHNGNHWQ